MFGGGWCILILVSGVSDWRISILIVRLQAVPSRVCCGTDQLLCCLIVGINNSGLSSIISLLNNVVSTKS